MSEIYALSLVFEWVTKISVYGCVKRKEYNPLLRAREGLENLDVLMSCRKMLIASSVSFQICSINLPSSF